MRLSMPVPRLVCIALMGIALVLAPGAGAQTFEQLHSFSNEEGAPLAPLILATDGNLYGTAASGGLYGYGSVFRLTPDWERRIRLRDAPFLRPLYRRRLARGGPRGGVRRVFLRHDVGRGLLRWNHLSHRRR